MAATSDESDGLTLGQPVRFWSRDPRHELAEKRDGRIHDIDGDRVTVVWTYSSAGVTHMAEKSIPRDRIID